MVAIVKKEDVPPIPYDEYKVDYIQRLRNRRLVLKEIRGRMGLLDIKAQYVGDYTYKQIKAVYKKRYKKAKQVELVGVDKILFKYWVNLLLITTKTIKLIAFDNVKEQIFDKKPYKDIFNDKYALVLDERWLDFETFLKEIKEIKYFDLFEVEQNLPIKHDEQSLKELQELPNLYPSTVYSGSNVFSKDTVDFVSLHEVRDYLKVSDTVYHNPKTQEYSIKPKEGFFVSHIPTGYLIRYQKPILRPMQQQ